MTATPSSVTPQAETDAAAAIYLVLERYGCMSAEKPLTLIAQEAATEALAAAGPLITEAEQAHCVRVVAAEGQRLTQAAMQRMAMDQLDDDQMVTQVLRGSTIGNLARRLPDMLRSQP